MKRSDIRNFIKRYYNNEKFVNEEMTPSQKQDRIAHADAASKGEEEYMHRGVSTRTFARGFNLSDDVEIGEVTFNNGMLIINLQKIVPDHQKLKLYEIK